MLSNNLDLIVYLIEDKGVDFATLDDLGMKLTDLALACGYKEISDYLYRKETGG